MPKTFPGQFDKEIAEINKHLAGKQWELHQLSKQMDSLVRLINLAPLSFTMELLRNVTK